MDKDTDDEDEEDESVFSHDQERKDLITDEERELLVKNLVVARIRQLPDNFRISIG